MSEIPIINGVQPPFMPIGGIEVLRNDGVSTNEFVENKESKFQTILNKELHEVKFSKHALERMKSRNINLSESDVEKLENAVSKAEEKGSYESLVVLNDFALVVSVKNRTVITAVDSLSSQNIFTNIDSAIFI